MKTEDLIREYIRTHESDENIAKRARIQQGVRPKTPVNPRGK